MLKDTFFFLVFRATLAAYGSSHMLRIGVKLKLQLLQAYATDTAMRDLHRVCNLHHSSQQRRILNPPSEARDQTCVFMNTIRFHFHSVTIGTPPSPFFFFSPKDNLQLQRLQWRTSNYLDKLIHLWGTLEKKVSQLGIQYKGQRENYVSSSIVSGDHDEICWDSPPAHRWHPGKCNGSQKRILTKVMPGWGRHDFPNSNWQGEKKKHWLSISFLFRTTTDFLFLSFSENLAWKLSCWCLPKYCQTEMFVVPHLWLNMAGWYGVSM